MLAFDIETTGLDPTKHEITCICAYDPDQNIERAFLLGRGESGEEFLAMLDAADRLCAFNGIWFDLPFIQKRLGLEPERVERWIAKTWDLYYTCYQAFGRGFKLDRALELNGLETKTGSGVDAIVFAREGRWDELRDYCMHDTKQTYRVSSLPQIQIPHVGGVVLTPSGDFVRIY